MSTEESTLDALVQRASTPTLASLFKKAKENGLITAITGYGPNKEKKAEPGNQSGQPLPPRPGQNVGINAKFNSVASPHHQVPVNPNLS